MIWLPSEPLLVVGAAELLRLGGMVAALSVGEVDVGSAADEEGDVTEGVNGASEVLELDTELTAGGGSRRCNTTFV